VTVRQPVLGGPRPAAQRVQGQIRFTQIRIDRGAEASDFADLTDQCVEPRVQVGDALPEAGRAFVRQQIHRKSPAAAGLAEHPARVDHHVVEVHLTELVDIMHGAQRAHGDARGVEIDEEGGDRLVVGSVRVAGSGQQDAAVRVLGETRPHLLAVDDPLVAALHGTRCQRRQVTARARLGKPLAPLLFAAEQSRHHLGGQFSGRVVDHRRCQHFEHRVRPRLGQPAAHHLLADDGPQYRSTA